MSIPLSSVSASPEIDERPAPVLVTGAGGFVGSHLARHLAGLGHRVVALDRDLERWRGAGPIEGLELRGGDLVDPEIQHQVLHGVDTVYHLAAAHLGAAVPEQEFWRVNVDGLRALAEAAAQAGVRRFVHTSSVGVYGQIDRPPADEDSPCHPDHAYERTKLAGEEALQELAARLGLPIVVLRPVWIYGPGCGRTERLFRAIRKGRFLIAGSGRSLRHCIYIDDMVAALVLAATSERAVGETLIVGDAEAVTVRRLVDEIARLTGGRLPPSLPLWVLSWLAMACEAAWRPLRREPPLSRRSLRFFTGNTAFRIDRARSALGFEPRYDLAAGLAATWRALAAAEVPARGGRSRIEA